ncbi:ATPase protein [Marine Group I thaumarchaeote SCGC AAA799-N04]|uniref:ATPase protein n=3 Tax=Marine Group I TaxID=905826 RepID=A0A081RNW8_9ARCH|nr:ATPase protein [Marine Group I thaumarchaeote SCGC AAA799-N04]
MSHIKLDVIGFGNNEMAYGIPTQDRIHMAIFGEVGSGKSETMKLLIAQNINRNQGFLLIDPHGMLARDVLELIPKEKWEKVIYISPASIHQSGRTVRINPLEYKTDEERYIVAMSFVNALHNLHKDAWGDRLEAILRNACNALVEVEGSTLRDLRMLVSDQRARSIYLSKVTSKDTIHFWKNTFEKQYSREAGSAAYNKLDKILATPPVAAMLDAPTSSVDFSDALNTGKFIIVDLSSGTSDDITSFLGSIILHMVYVEAKKRVDNTEQLGTPFYIYIDEAHLFSPFALREILNTMRKFNVKVTLATQTINAYPKRVADEIPALARTIICFKCDTGTAHMFRNLLPLQVDEMVGLSLHRFSFYSQGVNPIVGVGMTHPIRTKLDKWQNLAKFSVQRYGEAISLRKYIPPTKRAGEYPDIIACESCILLLIKKEENYPMTREEIFEKMNLRFGADKRLVYDSIESLVRGQYLDRKIEKREDANQFIQRFVPSKLANNTFFSTTAMGRRAGSTLHLAAIFYMRKMIHKIFKYCIIDLGDAAEQRPDILVFEPDTYRDEKDRLRYDLENWSDEIIAVEVEVDPTKHAGQVVTNYTKNFEKGFVVWFVVFSEKHRDYIKKVLSEAGIDEKLYDVMIFNKEQILKSYESSEDKDNSSTHLSEIESQVLALLGESPSTAQSITSQMPVSTNTVLQAMKSLEQKNLVDPGYSEVKTKKTDLKRDAIIKRAQKKKYYELTPQGKEILHDDGEKSKESPKENNYDDYLPEQSDDVLLEHLRDPNYKEKQNVILILENRGYRVSIKNNKVKLYKKRS